MKINPVQNNNSTAFGATIVKTHSMEKFYGSICKGSGNPVHKKLWECLSDAVAKHPSENKIYLRVNYIPDIGLSKGILSNLSDVYIDNTLKTTGYYAVWSTWRNILDPKNKKEFHKLFGKKYEPIYDNWWQNNIQPIWKILSKFH